MTAFFTKKQKVQMRKRKLKKKKLAQPPGESTSSDNCQVDAAASSRKRKRPDAEPAEEESSSQQEETTTSSNTITVPAHLIGKEAKKFRKDARRRVRAEGGDDGHLVFVVEGQEEQHESQKDDTHETSSHTHKKPKKSYPCINELLQQQRQEHILQLQEAGRQEAEDRIPDDIKAKYVALDCEMVGIGSDGKHSALARVSLVDWHGNVVLDTFVQVPSRVTDFRTFVSGVRAKDIHDKTAMNLNECRRRVADLLQRKILVGHALKNDLQALLLTHPKQDIRDTAKYRPFQRASGPNGGKWRPRKLRDLVKEHLGTAIQVQGEAHDSTEDAGATMELFKRVRVAWEKDLEQRAARNERTKKR